MNVTLLVNPAARSGAHSAAARVAAERLRELGVKATTVSGGSAAESSRLIRAALDLGTDAVIVAGGDGTVSLAAQELAGSTVPLGIVPTGTGNDFADALGLGGADARAAADLVGAGAIRAVDLARITRTDGSIRYFASVLASGFDSRVNDRANAMRWPRGGSRYTLAIGLEFLRLRGIPFDLVLRLPDGTREHLDEDLVMATVGNTRTYGGRIPICPDADPADGQLDVTLVRPMGRLRLARSLPRVYRGTHITLPEVVTRRVTGISLASPGVTAYADGDPVGPLPLSIDVAPGALRVFAPAR